MNYFLLVGWWQYDERTSIELEASYKAGERTCELLIAGFLYVTDLEAMLQLRRNDPSRRRRIKRDLATIPKKGVMNYSIMTFIYLILIYLKVLPDCELITKAKYQTLNL